MYLTYEQYTDMGGALSELDFNFLEYEAESYINWYTFDRLKGQEEIPQEVIDCMFYLIRLIQVRLGALGIGAIDTSSSSTSYGSAVLAGQSNDGVSVSYNSLAAHDAIKSISDEIGDTIKRHLRGVVNNLGRKLLYRGLYPNE